MMVHLKISSITLAVGLTASLVACKDSSDETISFDFQKCIEKVPEKIEGLEILSGPRSKESLIHDMRHAVCGGYFIFEQMKSNGEPIETGSVLFKVLVEYTGEVNRVTIEETTIQSEALLRKTRELILNTDFVSWRDESDEDCEFLYPIDFSRYE
jgi:hypothetical protein